MSSEVADEEAFSSVTAIVFAVISLVIYVMFLRPTTTRRPAAPATGRPTGTPRQRPRVATPNNPAAAAAAGSWNQTGRPRQTRHLSEAAAEIFSECISKPQHVKTSIENVGMGGSNVLQDGLVAFSHTLAASAVENPTSLRPERAKILSRLMSSSSTSKSGATTTMAPPSKGSTLVVSLSQADLNLNSSSSTIPRILYVLATYYSLMVLVAVEDEQKADNKDSIVRQLRSSSPELTEKVLPSHRILLSASTTCTGRVAVVRQLSKVAMVVDWDEEVANQLGRFGYKVALVPNWSKLLD